MSTYLFMALVRKSRTGLISATALVLLLAACGGGSDSAAPPAQAVAASPVASTPVAAPPDVVSAYPVGSEELVVYTLLNAERNRCGFGLLAANTQLDAAAKAHAEARIPGPGSS